MNTNQNQDPDAFAHGPFYLLVRRFIRKNSPFLIGPWTSLKRMIWLIRYRTPEERFRQIHSANYWANAESRSGEGSTLEATRRATQAIEEFVQTHEVRSMLDVPCGDFNWMKNVDLGIPYIGGDIVDALIADNEKRYANGMRKFQVIDLTKSKLPQCELVHTRDCLNHLSIPDIKSALTNICSSGATYIAITQFPAVTVNRNQASGFTYRELNFRLPPFNWPEPVILIDEESHPGKHLGFWRISDLPT